MCYGMFTLCLTLMLIVTLTVSIELDPPKPFGTKTIYDWSFTDEETTERNVTDLPAPDACRPLYVGAFLRHGTRNPSDGDVEEAMALMDRIGGHILAPEYLYLNNYVFPFTIEEESQLVAVGYQEHVGLGRRFASRVQQLLEDATEAELRLIASMRNRSIDSAKGFRQGLADILGKFDDKPIVINNNLTRYYDNCERYIVEVDDDPETAEEEQKFANGSQMRLLASMLSDRLQLNVSDLTSELYSILAITAQEEGILGRSNWTDVWYNTDELDVLDYYEDFEAYWERGYAYPITYEMSCVVLEEMFKEMDAAKSANQGNSSSHPKGTFMFGHSSSVIPLECLLGLFNDSTLPILADNYDQQANRTYRASRIDPMAANVAFVLYECDEGTTNQTAPDGVDWPPTLDRYMVQLMFKEMSTKIPNACGYDLCPYDEVRSHFQEYVNRCNFDQRCAVEDDNDDDDDDNRGDDTTDNTAAPSHNTPIVLVTLAAFLSMFTTIDLR